MIARTFHVINGKHKQNSPGESGSNSIVDIHDDGKITMTRMLTSSIALLFILVNLNIFSASTLLPADDKRKEKKLL